VSDLDTALTAWITLFAAAMFVVALMAYVRLRNTRLLLVSAAFGVFLAKGVVLSAALVSVTVAAVASTTVMLALDTLILLLLAASVLRK